MELPAELNLKVGETYTLSLPGLGTAGYLWAYAIGGSDDSVDVSAVTDANSQPEAGPNTANVGSSRDEQFTIRAVKPGHAAIRFSQRRPWETTQPPVNEHIVQVDVKN